jgi:hypothetical protein
MARRVRGGDDRNEGPVRVKKVDGPWIIGAIFHFKY